MISKPRFAVHSRDREQRFVQITQRPAWKNYQWSREESISNILRVVDLQVKPHRERSRITPQGQDSYNIMAFGVDGRWAKNRALEKFEFWSGRGSEIHYFSRLRFDSERTQNGRGESTQNFMYQERKRLITGKELDFRWFLGRRNDGGIRRHEVDQNSNKLHTNIHKYV